MDMCKRLLIPKSSLSIGKNVSAEHAFTHIETMLFNVEQNEHKSVQNLN